MEYNTGDIISNRFEIFGKLQGGFGIVYIIYDHRLRYPIAAKTYPYESYGNDTHIAEAFAQECEKWIGIDMHPNIVRAASIHYLEGNRPYLFLEYINGGNLQEFIDRGMLRGNMKLVLDLALDICEGMIFANEQGISVHRDLKPSNILLNAENTAMITDFGLCIGRDPALNQNGMTGTLPYMSPEQFGDDGIDTRSDIYSFGHMLYHMITGHTAYRGYSLEDYRLLHHGAKFPSQDIPDKQLAAIISKCTEKDKEKRYPGFTYVKEALAALYYEMFHSRRPDVILKYDPEYELHKQAIKSGALIELKKIDEAIAICQDVIEKSKDPVNLSIAFNHLGWAMGREKEEYEKCEPYFRKAISYNPENYIALGNLGLSLRQQGKTQEAIQCYQKCIRLNPSHLASYLNLGTAYLAMGESDLAEETYLRGIAVNPKYYNINLTLMNFYKEHKKEDEKRFYYAKKVLETEPWDIFALIEVFYHHALNDESSELAITAHQKLLRLDNPTINEESFFWVASARFYNKMKRNVQLAHDYSLKAIALDPENHLAYMELANSIKNAHTYSANNKEIPLEICDIIIDIYERVIEIKPDHSEAYRLMGKYLERQEKYNEAMAVFQKAREIAPDDSEVMNDIGNLYRSAGTIHQSVFYYEEAIALNPENAMFYYNLADCYIDLKDYDEGIRLFNEAIRLREEYPEAYHSLGLCHMMKDEFDAALYNYKMALYHNEHHHYAWESMGKAYLMKNDPHNGIACLKNASITYERIGMTARKAECEMLVAMIISKIGE